MPYRMIEVANNAAIGAALAAGFGCSLVSAAAVPAGVPTRELGDEFVRRFYALVPRSGLTPGQRELAGRVIAALRG